MENIFNKKYIITNGIVKFDINDTTAKNLLLFPIAKYKEDCPVPHPTSKIFLL